eukprot:1136247-Pelagomonas_calceolata.AAC.3
MMQVFENHQYVTLSRGGGLGSVHSCMSSEPCRPLDPQITKPFCDDVQSAAVQIACVRAEGRGERVLGAVLMLAT